jgi:hypothetical protein
MEKKQNFTLENLQTVKDNPKGLCDMLDQIAWYNYTGELDFLIMTLWYVSQMRINIQAQQTRHVHRMSTRKRELSGISLRYIARTLVGILAMPSRRERLKALVQNIDPERLALFMRTPDAEDRVLKKGTAVTIDAICCVIYYFEQTGCEKVAPYAAPLSTVMRQTELKAFKYLPDWLRERLATAEPCSWYKHNFLPI